MNQVTLIGVCGKYGFSSVRYLPSGTAVASGSITISEPTKDGRTFETFFGVEVHGSKAEAASELEAGRPILVNGKLSKRKAKDGTYETIVSTYHVQALGAQQCAAEAAAAPNVADDDDIPF